MSNVRKRKESKKTFFAVKSRDGVRVIDQKLTQRGAEVIQARVCQQGRLTC